MAVLGTAVELGAFQLMKRRLGLVAEPFERGRPHRLLRAAEVLTASGTVLAGVAGRRRSRALAATAGAALLTGSAALRFGVFHAGVASAEDPKYTVASQRERLTGHGD
ncbi:hypothetical protein ABZ281_49910 [Streptomyces sp. NPDC006265]|uniref:hypothetical protein n=1 Tax=Streptomyces sp. NPDC006265 TaxID=3156740 RepID=UPI0033B376D3